MPRPPRGRRSTTVAAALVAIVLLGGIALWLEFGTEGRHGALLEAAPDGTDPVAALTAAGRSHRFLFLSDAPGADAPDRLAASTIEALARSVGLDAVVLAVPEDQQRWIDAFLAAPTEDASGLLMHPAAAGGPGLPLLPLLRRIHALNRELGAARSIRVVAADAPDWPPARALAPAQAVQRWAARDAHMHGVVEARILSRNARARVLFFVDGLHALRLPFELRTGGTAPAVVVPLAARVAETTPREVWSALIDAPQTSGALPTVAALTGSPAREALRRAGLEARPFATSVSDAFGSAGPWLAVSTQPGVSFQLVDDDAPFRRAFDGYVHLTR